MILECFLSVDFNNFRRDIKKMFTDIFGLDHRPAKLVNNFALFVHDIVILQRPATYGVIMLFNATLGSLN